MIVNEEKEREYLKEMAENHNVSFEQLWNDFTKSEWGIDDFIATVVKESND